MVLEYICHRQGSRHYASCSSAGCLCSGSNCSSRGERGHFGPSRHQEDKYGSVLPHSSPPTVLSNQLPIMKQRLLLMCIQTEIATTADYILSLSLKKKKKPFKGAVWHFEKYVFFVVLFCFCWELMWRLIPFPHLYSKYRVSVKSKKLTIYHFTEFFVSVYFLPRASCQVDFLYLCTVSG